MSGRIVRAPRRLVAEEFYGAVGRGRCAAVKLGARENEAADLVECVVKFDAALTMPPTEHLLEWVAAELGRHLGVQVPPSAEVVIERGFAESIEDRAAKGHALKSLGSVYGSEFVTSYSPPILGVALPVDLRLAAAELVAFDVFIHNYDRKYGSNPNVLVGRAEVMAFDHGDAFGFMVPLLGADDPVTTPLLDVVQGHVFGAAVRALRGGVSLDRFGAAVADLDDEFFDALRAAVPAAWTRGQAEGKVERLVSVLRQRRDSLGRWLPLVQAWMLS